MASELANLSSGTQRTRRNLMKMGAIAVPATLATVRSASAGQGPICIVLGLFGLPCPPTHGNGNGNGNGNGGHSGNCFLKGTGILTADGERKIEDLAIGDLLLTKFGGLRPIRWIGRYSFKKSDPSKPWVKDALPVRIARSALAPNVPHTDLYMTGGHSLLIDGVLVPAELLINGTTITRDEVREYDELEFLHVKLESHDVIYAEGVPAETLINVQESAVNFADYLRRYGTAATDEEHCAPHIHIWGGRPELVSRLRSALSAWIDLRNQAEVMRDRLEERAYVLSQEPEIAV
jgi:Hint domain